MIQNLKNEISRLKKEIGQLQGMIETDFITGLYNRHGFIKRAEGFLESIEWRAKHREERRNVFYIKDFTIIFIDLDNFKSINDTFGHKIGDDIVKSIADILKTNIKTVDILCRWGGDEFVLGLIGVGERAGLIIAEKLRRKIASHKFDAGKGIVRTTASFGVASALQCYKQTKSINLYRLIEEADEAMYEAKKKFGKNFAVSYHKIKK